MAKDKKTGCLGYMIILFIIALVIGAITSSISDSGTAPTPPQSEPPATPKPISKEEPSKQKADTNTPEYQAAYKNGHADGFIVGKTDAWEGRKRDGRKAMTLAAANAKGQPNAAAYKSGYHLGYNDGYYAAINAGAPGAKR